MESKKGSHRRRQPLLLNHRVRRLGRVDSLGDTPERLEDVVERLALPESVPDGEVAGFLRGAGEEEVAYAREGEEAIWGDGESDTVGMREGRRGGEEGWGN